MNVDGLAPEQPEQTSATFAVDTEGLVQVLDVDDHACLGSSRAPAPLHYEPVL
jgi:hypothetical protein